MEKLIKSLFKDVYVDKGDESVILETPGDFKNITGTIPDGKVENNPIRDICDLLGVHYFEIASLKQRYIPVESIDGDIRFLNTENRSETTNIGRTRIEKVGSRVRTMIKTNSRGWAEWKKLLDYTLVLFMLIGAVGVGLFLFAYLILGFLVFIF